MKFVKTAVAVAVAGIASAPMIASADTTLSGAVQINMNGSDADGDAGDIRVGTGDVILGLVSEHELNSGLTGYGSLRFDLDSLSNSVTQIDTANEDGDVQAGTLSTAPSGDNVYVGIKGGFGDVRLGEIPLAVEYGQVANDIFDVGAEISGGLSYTGNFGPVGLIANFSPGQNQDVQGVGAKFTLGGFNIGVGAENRDELINASVGVSFDYAGATVALHGWSKEIDEDNGDLDQMSIAGVVGYNFGGISAKVTYALLEDDAALDQQALRLDLGYDLGGGLEISTRVTATSDDNDDDADLTAYRVQLAKSF